MGQSVGHAVALKGELDELRQSEAQLRLEMQGIRRSASEAHGDSQAAKGAVADVEAKLESFAQLQELSKTTEQRLAALNALAEHVSHKAKALEAQKLAVERAVVEATRLNEMVWNMDAQLAKLAAGGDQVQRAEATVARMEELARATADELAAATAAR
jgi:chromosome segregation ATPase